MKRFSLLHIGTLTAILVSLAPAPTLADEWDKQTIVTFDGPVEVPGMVLQPGKYVIRLLNSQSNRHIAEIMNERMDHLYALTFTAAAQRLEPTGKTVLTFYEGKNGRPQALRKWFWPGDTLGQEFLYPKEQAARIAANTNEKVAEGNLPTVAESGQSMTPDNAKGLTLQSEDQSKPAEPAAASSFTASAAEPPPAPTIVIAQHTPPTQPATRSDDTPQPSSVAVSSNTSPSDQALPQTASHLPLIGAIGVISLALAVLVASVRRYRWL